MENKQRKLNEGENPLNGWRALLDAKKRQMTTEESHILLRLLAMTPQQVSRAYDQIREATLGLKILAGRLETTGWFPHIEKEVQLFCASLCEAPGESVLWAYTLAKMAEENGGKVDLEAFCAKDFAMGVPEKESVKQIWDFQKGFFHGLENDNLIDNSSLWPKAPPAPAPEAPKPKSKLTAERVDELFGDSLFRDEEDKTNFVRADGIMTNVGFHPERLEAHKAEIRELLEELPDEFKEEKGGGWSFLNAAHDRYQNHWAEHPTMEKLFLLGIATKQAAFLMPRELWKTLPGGMPYVVVKKREQEPELSSAAEKTL